MYEDQLDKITLKSIVAKMHRIADQEFDGRLTHNSLDIFRKLSRKEQSVFLEDTINILSITTHRKYHPILSTDEEQHDLKFIDGQELIRLKSWLTKVLVLFLLFSIYGFFSTLLTTTDHGEFVQLMKSAKDIGKIILDK